MKRLLLPGLCLVCMVFLRPCRAGEGPESERQRLCVTARDPAGGKLSFTWKQLENGAPRVKIADAHAARFEEGKTGEKGKWTSETYYIPTEPGKYMFEVTIRNEAGDETKRTYVQEVLPPTPPPVAVAGKNQDGKKVGENVVVSGEDSKAAEGRTIAKWEWRVVKAPGDFNLAPAQLRTRTFEFKPAEPGVYQFELKVTDDKNKMSEPARTTVTVVQPAPPPVAVAGKEQTRAVGDVVRVDGGDSKAAEGQTIAAWEWRVVQAPPGFAPDAALLKQRAFEFKAEAAGAYQFELRVSDGQRWSEPARTTVTVAPPPPPPVAAAGKDQTKTVGEVVRLNAVDSKAAEGLSIAEWEWRVVKAPEKFKLDAKLLKERSFDFKAAEPGEYQFELRVNDSKRWSEPARVTVTITPGQPPKIEDTPPAQPVELAPKPPVVDKKKPEVKPVVAPGGTLKVGETIVLDGSKSVVDESLTPEFFWKQDAAKGPLARQLVPDKTKPFSQARLADPLNFPVWTCKPEQPGEYTFVLEIGARAPGGGADTVTKTESEPVVFKVQGDGKEPPPTPPPPPAAGAPVAKINAERTAVGVGDMVKLDGSKSTGDKLEYVWGPVQGKRYPKTWAGTDGPVVEFKAEEEGEYAVALMVKDGAGKFSEQDRITIKVGPANQPPVVKLAKSFECVVGEQVRVEAEATDPEGDQLEYKWVCVDPPDLTVPDRLAKNSILVFVPRNTGAYVFKITVTDAKGASTTAQTMVGVKDALNRPPTAIIDGPKKPLGIGGKVKLSGERSSDPEKKALSFFWKQESGPNDVKVPGNVPGERDKTWEFTPTEPGRYVFTLVVSDGVSKSDPDKFELTVTKNNNLPAANIVGPPGGRLAVGEQAALDGTTSSDPEGDKLTYKWRKLEPRGNKPGDVELANADQERAAVKGVTPGPVRIELVVNDGTADSDPAYLDLVVARPNNRPVAVISGPTAARVGGPVELGAEQSSDPDGDEISYVWSQPSDGGPEIGVRGKELRKKTLRFKPERPGTYVVNLEVVDSEGAKSDVVAHKVEVKGTNKPPIAVASRVGTENVMAGHEVKLTARGSRDPEGAPLTYKWKQTSGETVQPFADGAIVNSEVVNFVPKSAGKYAFELVVNDGELDSTPAAVEFAVKAPNQPPVAVIADVVACEPGEKIVLDGTASRDPDGEKLEYRWSQVSGPTAKFPWRGAGRAKVEVTLPKEGEYVFDLKVFDGKEWSEPRQVTVKTRAANQPPVAALAVPEMRTEENLETVLDASASNDPDSGPRPLSFEWKQASGPAKVELTREGAKATFTPRKAGVYVFQVRVSDGKAESLPAEIKVDVMKAGSLPVALPQAIPNPVKAAQKGLKNDPNILILDGTRSRPGAENTGAKLTYQWKQLSGEDLRLKPADLAKERVGLRVFVPGLYSFSLTVSDGQNRSASARLDVHVIDGSSTGVSPVPPPKSDTTPPKVEPPPVPPPVPPPPPNAKDTPGLSPGDSSSAQPRSTGVPPVVAPPALSPRAQEIADLAKKEGPEAEKALIEALASPESDVRSAASVALAQRGKKSVPALIAVLKTGTAPAKKEAHWSLREISHESFAPDADKWEQWWAKANAEK